MTREEFKIWRIVVLVGAILALAAMAVGGQQAVGALLGVVQSALLRSGL